MRQIIPLYKQLVNLLTLLQSACELIFVVIAIYSHVVTVIQVVVPTPQIFELVSNKLPQKLPFYWSV